MRKIWKGLSIVLLGQIPLHCFMLHECIRPLSAQCGPLFFPFFFLQCTCFGCTRLCIFFGCMRCRCERAKCTGKVLQLSLCHGGQLDHLG